MSPYVYVTVESYPVTEPGSSPHWPRITGAIAALVLAHTTLETEVRK